MWSIRFEVREEFFSPLQSETHRVGRPIGALQELAVPLNASAV